MICSLLGLVLVVGWTNSTTAFTATATTAARTRSAASADGEFEIHVFDEDTGQALAARMHLRNSRGRLPRLPRDVVTYKDHLVFDGSIVLKLPPGTYTFEMECGPEYRLRTGEFVIRRGATDRREVAMSRFVDMRQEGWYAGDLHIHRPPQHIPLLMRAEQLDVAPVITWWNKQNPWAQQPPPDPLLQSVEDQRWFHLMGGEDERGGGALLYLNLLEPLPISKAAREYPSSLHYLNMAADRPGAHIDIEKPFWWDMPLWIASGHVHSIGIANNHMWRDGMLEDEAWGKPRDLKRYPPPIGNALWSQQIYYHLLNCGIKLPPSAGSASGVLPNPVGYNRAYVYCGDSFSYERWFDNLKAGRVVVTNGPMLRPRVNGELPGHTFYAADGESVSLTVQLKLSVRDPVDYLEIVRNGQVVQNVALEQYRENRGKLPPVTFDQSGWMMVRVVTKTPGTYRFAASGPYYVDIGGKPNISRASAQFFLDWVYERARQIKLDNPEQQRAVIDDHRLARDYWQRMVERANSE